MQSCAFCIVNSKRSQKHERKEQTSDESRNSAVTLKPHPNQRSSVTRKANRTRLTRFRSNVGSLEAALGRRPRAKKGATHSERSNKTWPHDSQRPVWGSIFGICFWSCSSTTSSIVWHRLQMSPSFRWWKGSSGLTSSFILLCILLQSACIGLYNSLLLPADDMVWNHQNKTTWQILATPLPCHKKHFVRSGKKVPPNMPLVFGPLDRTPNLNFIQFRPTYDTLNANSKENSNTLFPTSATSGVLCFRPPHQHNGLVLPHVCPGM